jgi:hypothetical protein
VLRAPLDLVEVPEDTDQSAAAVVGLTPTSSSDCMEIQRSVSMTLRDGTNCSILGGRRGSEPGEKFSRSVSEIV